MARGIAGGKRSALVSVCGVCSGYLAYAVLVALGLAALLRSSDVAFEAVRYAGAAYLLYLGVRMILSKGTGLGPGDDGDGEAKPDAAVLRQVFITAFFNPKGLVLFFSLLPQFVTPSAAWPVAGQLLVLGLVHTSIASSSTGRSAWVPGTSARC